MERLIVFPEFLESKQEVYPIASDRFDSTLAKWVPYGSRNIMNLIGFMDREPAEQRPHPNHIRVRQAVINVLLFQIPDDLYSQLSLGILTKSEAIEEVLSEAELLATQKLANSGESRLIGKLASGLGGHVDQGDFQPASSKSIDDLLRTAALRELCDEELTAARETVLHDAVAKTMRPLAILNSSFGDVESVHLGFVTVVTVPRSTGVAIRETDKLEAVWTKIPNFSNLKNTYKIDRWTELLFSLDAEFFAKKIIASVLP